jgi:hypothetical protein
MTASLRLQEGFFAYLSFITKKSNCKPSPLALFLSLKFAAIIEVRGWREDGENVY